MKLHCPFFSDLLSQKSPGVCFCRRQFLFVFVFLLCTLCIYPLSAQRKKRTKNTLLPTLRIDLGKSKQAQEENQPEKVIIDRTNIAVLDYIPQFLPSKKKLSKTAAHRLKRWTPTPANSLAAKLTPQVITKQLCWYPRWGGNFPNGINVDAAQLSPDKSVIAFLERLGNSSGPFATRIVLYNTHSWQIIQVQDIEEIYAKNCVWLNDYLTLVGIGQKSRHTKNTLAVYDPMKKKIISQTFIDFQPGESIVSNEKEWLLLTEHSPVRVHLFQLNKGSKTYKRAKIFEDFVTPPALASGSSGKEFYFCDKKFLYICRLADKRINEKIPLPANSLSMTPRKILPLKRNAFLLLPSSSSGAQAGYLKNNRLIPIGNPSSGTALQGIQKDSFIAGFSKGSELAIYHEGSLQRLNLFSAATIRPKTQGFIVFAFTIPHAQAVAVLDSRGIFYLLYPDRINKKFMKEILTKQFQ